MENGLNNYLRPLMIYRFGAEGETRTRTGVRPLDPEPSASTNSATSARNKVDIFEAKDYITAQILSILIVF